MFCRIDCLLFPVFFARLYLKQVGYEKMRFNGAAYCLYRMESEKGGMLGA